jgi:hypothetical protein
MIHVSVHRDSADIAREIKLSIVDEEAINQFTELVNRALNAWPDAPKDLKDLGDMLTHGRITQDHSFSKMNTKQSSDYYSVSETVKIAKYINSIGTDNWFALLRSGEAHAKIAELLK